MFCPQCGTHNDDNAWKCLNCQAELHSQAQFTPPAFNAEPPETSMKAIFSLVCGILGLCCCNLVFGPVAIVLGILARNDIKNNPGDECRGEGLAIAGIVLGALDVILGIISMIVSFVFLSRGGNPFPFPFRF